MDGRDMCVCRHGRGGFLLVIHLLSKVGSQGKEKHLSLEKISIVIGNVVGLGTILEVPGHALKIIVW